MNAEYLIEKLMDHYQLYTLIELADKIQISQPAITKWKTRNAVDAIKKKCRTLGIYNEIFNDKNIQGFYKESSGIEAEKSDLSKYLRELQSVAIATDKESSGIEAEKGDLSKYLRALQSVAIATDKEDELISDIKELIKKYIH